ncbi:hypothetical protein [Deinococcus hohokamensis]|uniref:DUF3168 domain-containing protein n=1 Tax=Deinococcus hohokamensis TaxID=309883 RepID=A0ABV9I6H3_9DEIO
MGPGALAQQGAPAPAAGSSPGPAQGPTPEQAAQIIERLSAPYLGPSGSAQTVYGAVPAGLPLALGAPIDVLVSFRAVYGNNVAYRVLLSSALDPEAALHALDAQLATSGWRGFGGSSARIGFLSPQADQYRNYYLQRPVATVRATRPMST